MALQCSICVDGSNPEAEWSAVRPCGHIFHTHCLQKALDYRNKCPFCRVRHAGVCWCHKLVNCAGRMPAAGMVCPPEPTPLAHFPAQEDIPNQATAVIRLYPQLSDPGESTQQQPISDTLQELAARSQLLQREHELQQHKIKLCNVEETLAKSTKELDSLKSR